MNIFLREINCWGERRFWARPYPVEEQRILSIPAHTNLPTVPLPSQNFLTGSAPSSTLPNSPLCLPVSLFNMPYSSFFFSLEDSRSGEPKTPPNNKVTRSADYGKCKNSIIKAKNRKKKT
jgi:hypothetical protein